MKVAIINPHRADKKGAYSTHLKIHEYDFFLTVTSYIVKILNIYGVEVRRFIRSSMHDAYKYAIEYNPHISIEPHFNAIEDKNIEGSICLYENNVSKKPANSFLECISNTLYTKKLYIKKLKEKDRGYKNLKRFKTPAIITESFFGTSKKDCNKINKELIASAHGVAIMRFLKR